MGFLSFFQKKPDALAQKAQSLFNEKQYAQAVREYEKALDRHEKNPFLGSDFTKKITRKIQETKNALAGQHLGTAEELTASQCFDDAKELLDLTLELTDDRKIKEAATKLLEDIQTAQTQKSLEYEDEAEDGDMGREEEITEADFDDSEYATALLSSMPEEEQEVYQEYGQAFIRGFAALNQGDFERAADYLEMALNENPDQTHIPLELGTAYLNLGELTKAKDLLEVYLDDFPVSPKGYQIYCEILWSINEYDRALAVLQSCPDELSETGVITLLTGETFSQSGNTDEAIALYKTYLNQNPVDESVLRALGDTYEKIGQVKEAQQVYAELMNAYARRGRHGDTELKRKYADTSYAAGHHTLGVLEIYLELTTTDPNNRGEYFDKISVIYKALGNEAESQRFKDFAGKASNANNPL